MKNFLRIWYKKIYQKTNYDVHKALLMNGKILSQLNSQKQNIESLDEVEFQVFSQRGEDGIIQYLISKIEIPNKIFVEFGVETYTESNTRFLLMNNNWSGLVLDGSEKNIDFIKKDFIYWKYDITAKRSFITKDNINDLISSYTKTEDIGLLSVDIDGNDYWVWEAINCIQPRIVICEYNSAFGPEKKVTIPYKENFIRGVEHYSELYFGASLAAFCDLAEKKGYQFVGTTSAGVNAYFVRNDVASPFKKYTQKEGFNESANRDSKTKVGKLSFLRHSERLRVIENMPVFDLEKGEILKIKDSFK
ncbi:hypothetical protein [Flavobacterium macacae]|uniref:Uncharacterized protein n=1 Tax=Flavobacterium macacae TaxID=2488993 RepID=A0A3P3WG82_9FLAO|nr:hypothetical protein [Flavobacterium macacae]RRJ94142.1 hypothetical protein EG849_01340 [Flavobacterium macacae]